MKTFLILISVILFSVNLFSQKIKTHVTSGNSSIFHSSYSKDDKYLAVFDFNSIITFYKGPEYVPFASLKPDNDTSKLGFVGFGDSSNCFYFIDNYQLKKFDIASDSVYTVFIDSLLFKRPSKYMYRSLMIKERNNLLYFFYQGGFLFLNLKTHKYVWRNFNNFEDIFYNQADDVINVSCEISKNEFLIYSYNSDNPSICDSTKYKLSGKFRELSVVEVTANYVILLGYPTSEAKGHYNHPYIYAINKKTKKKHYLFLPADNGTEFPGPFMEDVHGNIIFCHSRNEYVDNNAVSIYSPVSHSSINSINSFVDAVFTNSKHNELFGVRDGHYSIIDLKEPVNNFV